jgi:hypothetical protein
MIEGPGGRDWRDGLYPFLEKEMAANLSVNHDREAREIFLCYLRDDGTLVLGMGNHDCSLYRLSPSQLRNLARDSVRLALERKDIQVRPPPRNTGV